MANRDDWVKVRTCLRTHPCVIGMAGALNADVLRVIGALFVVWSVFDEHGECGVLAGYTPEAMDSVIGWQGFSVAMLSVGWLTECKAPAGRALALPEVEAHNTMAAKRRSVDMYRKRVEREPAAAADSTSAVFTVDDSEACMESHGRLAILDGGADIPVIDGETGEVLPAQAPVSSASLIETAAALNRLGIRTFAHNAKLSDLLARGISPQEIVLCAADMAIRKAGADRNPGWPAIDFELFASGATAAQMRLSEKQYLVLRRCVPNMGLLVATIEGRANDQRLLAEAAEVGGAPALGTVTPFRNGGARSGTVVQSMMAVADLVANFGRKNDE